MDGVGDADDLATSLHLLPHGVRSGAVQIGHGVGDAREPECPHGHVEGASTQLLELGLGQAEVGAQVHEAVDGVRFVPLQDGRVGREDHVLAGPGPGGLEGGALGHALVHQLESGEERMALVEVVDVGLDAQGLQGPHAADAQHHLLGHPLLAEPAVELPRDPAGFAVVLLNVRVQQVEGVHTEAVHARP